VNPNVKVLMSLTLILPLFLCTLVGADETQLTWSTFLKVVATDGGFSITVDNSGNAYVTGWTESSDFPTTVGVFDTSHNSQTDVFVAKLYQTGNVLGYSTFLGGMADDLGYGIAVDNSGNAYVTGETWSSNFPYTAGAFDTTHNGEMDAFVAKLSPDGNTLTYATFIGGFDFDYGNDIAVDNSGYAYTAGVTFSADFPVVAGSYDTEHNDESDAFVAKLNPAGSDLSYSSFVGGDFEDEALAIALAGAGYAYIVGNTASDNFPVTAGAYDTTPNGDFDVFAAKFNTAGSDLDYATLLGGNNSDYGRSIVVDDSLYAYVTGETFSNDFPSTSGAFDEIHNGDLDVFVVKLNPEGSDLDYASFLGGTSSDIGYGIFLDDSLYAYVIGETFSAGFPTTAGAFDVTYNDNGDAFVAKLNPAGSSLGYASFLGGHDSDIGYDIVLDGARGAYLTGITASPNFPTTPTAFDTDYNGDRDVFVVKFNFMVDSLEYATFLGGGDYVPVEPTTSLATLPTTYALDQNYPNPFNPETTFRFHIPQGEQVNLRIYNATGQLVKTLTDGHREAGSYEVRWNGRNTGGYPVPSGIYFCRMKAGDFVDTKKMALIR
jgi:hypothetical protein